ncbi:thioredoxin-like protein [Trametes polyzona]|nr:thioredoxin-like protein [Trametes polyzona]
MPETKRITLYSAEDSPFPHRVRLALEEAKAKYDLIEINLMNKEEWYEKKVYPGEGRVPVLIYGGPELPPDEVPSPEAVKVVESLVILEFLVDIFPEARLLPADPALRAKARLFAHLVDAKLLRPFMGMIFLQAPAESFLPVLETFQAMLPPTGYVAGEWSIGDAAFVPFLARLMMSLENGLGNFAPGVVQECLEALHSPRFARLRKYYEDNVARPSMAKTFNKDVVKQKMVERLERFRKTGVINSDMRFPVPAA